MGMNRQGRPERWLVGTDSDLRRSDAGGRMNVNTNLVVTWTVGRSFPKYQSNPLYRPGHKLSPTGLVVIDPAGGTGGSPGHLTGERQWFGPGLRESLRLRRRGNSTKSVVVSADGRSYPLTLGSRSVTIPPTAEISVTDGRNVYRLNVSPSTPFINYNAGVFTVGGSFDWDSRFPWQTKS